MKKAYIFNLKTFEYESVIEVKKDNIKSLLTGKDCYLRPYNSTFTEPLPEKEEYAIIWKNNQWHYIKDYRNKYVISGNNFYKVDYLGEIKKNERLLTDTELEKLKSGNYVCNNGLIIEREKTKEEKQMECMLKLNLMLIAKAVVNKDSDEYIKLKQIVTEFDNIK